MMPSMPTRTNGSAHPVLRLQLHPMLMTTHSHSTKCIIIMFLREKSWVYIIGSIESVYNSTREHKIITVHFRSYKCIVMGHETTTKVDILVVKNHFLETSMHSKPLRSGFLKSRYLTWPEMISTKFWQIVFLILILMTILCTIKKKIQNTKQTQMDLRKVIFWLSCSKNIIQLICYLFAQQVLTVRDYLNGGINS